VLATRQRKYIKVKVLTVEEKSEKKSEGWWAIKITGQAILDRRLWCDCSAVEGHDGLLYNVVERHDSLLQYDRNVVERCDSLLLHAHHRNAVECCDGLLRRNYNAAVSRGPPPRGSLDRLPVPTFHVNIVHCGWQQTLCTAAVLQTASCWYKLMLYLYNTCKYTLLTWPFDGNFAFGVHNHLPGQNS